MLLNLTVKNLAIVSELSLDFQPNMNVLTGETGAGKSILLNALNLALGDRATTNSIRETSKQAEITAQFALTKLPEAKEWLIGQDLAEEQDCIVRRILSRDGGNKAYINGHPVTLAQLKQLGEILVHMHSQHQHHALLDSHYQQNVLDQYGNHYALLQELAIAFKTWGSLQAEYQHLTDATINQDKLQLLTYQLQEITELAFQPNELPILEQEHKKLAKAQELITAIEQIYTNLAGDQAINVLATVHTAHNSLKKLLTFNQELESSVNLLEQVLIFLEEIKSELTKFLQNLDVNPMRLQQIETRLSTIYALARKHNINADFITEHTQILLEQHTKLKNKNLALTTLAQQIDTAKDAYYAVAQKLSLARKDLALNLSQAITTQIRNLGMPHAEFAIKITSNKPSGTGIDKIDFLVTTNPGQSLQPLNKIASGGELARISLAIQVILSQKIANAVLIFDEVDAGISGATAEIVGKALKDLAQRAQVICVTHLPQVAAQGATHFKISKFVVDNNTYAKITEVQGEARIAELARLLGGSAITKQAIANAKAMLAAV